MQKSNISLAPTETLKLAGAKMTVLSGIAEWGELKDTARACWTHWRTASALQAIVDCNTERDDLNVSSVMRNNVQKWEYLQ